MRIRRRARFLPADDHRSGWLETLPPLAPAPRLAAEERADCAVIGAGFTGLAVARRLAELRPEWRVVILEAQRAGFGATGRASGFVVDLTDFASRMPTEARDRYVGVARAGVEELRALVRERGLDCDWDETGWIRAAGGAAGVAFLDGMPALYDRLGIRYLRLDADAMHGVTGSRFYRAGIRLPGYPLVHSGKLLRGLLQMTPKSVVLYEDTPVTAIEVGEEVRLTAGDGTVVADRLFLATNGYTPGLGFCARRIFPLYTFGSWTRPLTAEEQRTLGGEREWGILAMDAMGSTVRRTRDQRILIRNTARYSRDLRLGKAVERDVARCHRQAFDARFPALAHVELEHSWAGLMGTAHNGQLSFGELRPKVFVAAGYTAAGIAMAQIAGRLLAEMSLGKPSPPLRDLLSLPPPTAMPPEPFRSLGGRVLTARMNAQAGEYL